MRVLITNQEIWAHLGNEGPVTIHTCVITEGCQSSVIPAGKRAILPFLLLECAHVWKAVLINLLSLSESK